MRNLTIKRTKSFVASLGKMKVYIEDPTASELLINQVPCRKLGVLKNGEVQTFQIGEEAVKIFVIADKLTKNYCNDFFQLPAGQEDVYLTGRNKFSLFAGNPFRFDNNDSEEVAANRKKGTRKGVIVLAVALLVGISLGYCIGKGVSSAIINREQTFSSNGMSITLTKRFRESDIENYTLAFESRDVAVTALQEPFTMMEGFEDYTLSQYGKLVLSANNQSAPLETEDGMTFFRYQAASPEDGKTYQYFVYLYKADDAFWLVQFVTQAADGAEYADDILQWAKSVEFSGSAPA